MGQCLILILAACSTDMAMGIALNAQHKSSTAELDHTNNSLHSQLGQTLVSMFRSTRRWLMTAAVVAASWLLPAQTEPPASRLVHSPAALPGSSAQHDPGRAQRPL